MHGSKAFLEQLACKLFIQVELANKKSESRTEIGNPYLWHILGMGMGLPGQAITLELDCFF